MPAALDAAILGAIARLGLVRCQVGPQMVASGLLASELPRQCGVGKLFSGSHATTSTRTCGLSVVLQVEGVSSWPDCASSRRKEVRMVV